MITYRDESQGDVTLIKDLCNQLMQYQADKTDNEFYRSILGSMNFENRMLPSFTATKEKQLLIAVDDDKLIGYVYLTVETLIKLPAPRPGWAKDLPENSHGLFPEWLEVPCRVGVFNNLYILPEYHGLSIGRELADRAMEWLKSRDDVNQLYVFVSHGNNAAAFYEKCGFRYSHEVFGGLIQAYHQELPSK